jgi:hypothetical protein
MRPLVLPTNLLLFHAHVTPHTLNLGECEASVSARQLDCANQSTIGPISQRVRMHAEQSRRLRDPD